MRTITGTAAKLFLLALYFAFASATLATPTNASESWFENFQNCHWKHFKLYCSGSRNNASSSTGLFPSRCNGELGFWTSVEFANGETFCITQSTADFYHNGNLVPTCTKKYFSHEDWKWHEVTSDGNCPAKKNYQSPN